MSCLAVPGSLGNADCFNMPADRILPARGCEPNANVGRNNLGTPLKALGPRHLGVAQGHLRKVANEVGSEVEEGKRPGKCEPALTRTADLRYDRPRRK